LARASFIVVSLQFHTSTSRPSRFCGRLWLRGTVQLRVWELQDVDEDVKTFWAQLLGTTESPERNVVRHWDPVTNEYVPATDTSVGVKPSRSFRSTETRLAHGSSPRRWSSQSFRVPIYRSRNGFLRPPVFGPDKVIVDPRIKAVHRQVMNEIIIVGLLSAAVRPFSLPHLHIFELFVGL
jgi:hypothetical protein